MEKLARQGFGRFEAVGLIFGDGLEMITDQQLSTEMGQREVSVWSPFQHFPPALPARFDIEQASEALERNLEATSAWLVETLG